MALVNRQMQGERERKEKKVFDAESKVFYNLYISYIDGCIHISMYGLID